MSESNQMTSAVIDVQFLSSLDKDQLVELLQHRTLLLISVRNLDAPDKDFINELAEDVKNIQAELKTRDVV